MSLINFQTTFNTYLKTEAQQLNDEIARLTAADCLDEAKFARVQLNIVDIFSQMLSVSVQKSNSASVQKSNSASVQKSNSASVQKSKNAAQWSDALSEAYLGFFEKIPSAWHINLEKCNAHGLHEEAHIETLKLDMAAKLKEAFIVQLDQYLTAEKEVH